MVCVRETYNPQGKVSEYFTNGTKSEPVINRQDVQIPAGLAPGQYLLRPELL